MTEDKRKLGGCSCCGIIPENISYTCHTTSAGDVDTLVWHLCERCYEFHKKQK